MNTKTLRFCLMYGKPCFMKKHPLKYFIKFDHILEIIEIFLDLCMCRRPVAEGRPIQYHP